MKPVQIVLVLVGATFAGFLGATAAVTLGGPKNASESREVVAVLDTSSAPAASPEAQPFGNAELDGLRGAVANLQREVEDLRTELARRAAPASETLAAAGTPVTPEALAAVNRDAVVQILEEQRQLEQKKRDEERKQREKEAIDRLAERAAKDLGLSPADQTRYGEFLVSASAKRDEMFRGMRDGNAGGPEGFRTAFEDYRTWAETELKGTFGNNLGQQIADYQREQMRGGGMGMFGGGDFGGRGAGGGTTPGGATGAQGGQTGRRGR